MSAPTIELTGRSGRSYSFHLYPWGQSFKAVGGLYVAIKQESSLAQALYPTSHAVSPGYSVQYVGQTGDLSRRPEHHHREASFRRVGVTHVAAIAQGDEQTRRQIEADLIGGLQPPLNRTAHG
jgi:hypothetical protein